MEPLLFVKKDGNVTGPYPLSDIRRLIGFGRILPDHSVSTNREGPWRTVGSVSRLASEIPAATAPQQRSERQPQPDKPQSPQPRQQKPSLPKPNRPMVFVSHSSKDRNLAVAVCADLEARGIGSWLAHRDIKPGADWGASIIEALSRSQVVVLLLTAHSNRSQHVMKEVERAVDRRIRIIPVRAEAVTLSKTLEYFLSSSQWLDATAEPFQQHLPSLSQRVLDLLTTEENAATASGSAGPIAVVTASPSRPPLPPKAWSRWFTLPIAAAIGGAAVAAVMWLPILRAKAPWFFGAPATSITVMPASGSTPLTLPVNGSDTSMLNPLPMQAPAERPPLAASPAPGLVEKVQRQLGQAKSLASWAENELSVFHQSVIAVTKIGVPELEVTSEGIADLSVRFKLSPRIERYRETSQRLVALLDTSPREHGKIHSDGLPTSDRFGLDAKKVIQEIRQNSWDKLRSGVIDIFGSDSVQSRASQIANKETCILANFRTLFLVFDPEATEEYSPCGVGRIADGQWSDLLSQDGTGIVVVLTEWDNSFRNTTWRWFHLKANEYEMFQKHAQLQFRCRATLIDKSGKEVASAEYVLQQYAISPCRATVVLSPFFVDYSFSFYVPEIDLLKDKILVPVADVARIADFRVSILEGIKDAR